MLEDRDTDNYVDYMEQLERQTIAAEETARSVASIRTYVAIVFWLGVASVVIAIVVTAYLAVQVGSVWGP